MNYAEFRRQLGKAGISIKDFAALLKLQPTSISSYARGGKVPDHLAVISSLMAEMADHGLNYRKVIEKLDLEPNKPRGARNTIVNEQKSLFDAGDMPGGVQG